MKKCVLVVLCLFVIGLFSIAYAVDQADVDQAGSQLTAEESKMIEEAKMFPSMLITDDEESAVTDEEEFSYAGEEFDEEY